MSMTTRIGWTSLGFALLLCALAMPVFAHTQSVYSAQRIAHSHFLQEQIHRYRDSLLVSKHSKSSTEDPHTMSRKQLFWELRKTKVFINDYKILNRRLLVPLGGPFALIGIGSGGIADY